MAAPRPRKLLGNSVPPTPSGVPTTARATERQPKRRSTSKSAAGAMQLGLRPTPTKPVRKRHG